MNNVLERVSNFIADANVTNSTTDKIAVIRKYDDLKLLFKYTYDTLMFTYGVTSDNIKKQKHLGVLDIKDLDLFDVLNDLHNRRYTGHNALKLVNTLIGENTEYEDIIYNIIDRNLKSRTDSKLINKVFPGLISEFSVALADKYEESRNINFTTTPYFASRKCDGVRCITIFDSLGDIRFYSREGKEFLTLDILKKDLVKLGFISIILDGEICIVNNNGDENFQDIMKEIRKKNHTIENPRYMIFDMIDYDGFYNKRSDRKLSDVFRLLKVIETKCSNVKALDQIYVNDHKILEQLISHADRLGWEGLIIRRADSDYEGKRTKNMLKIKNFKDQEYIVKTIINGPMRHIVAGKEITTEMLSSVEIEHKGYTVNVGSGFTIDERLFFKENPEQLIGKTITVKYFEETTDCNGKLSLRFPTIKAIHGNRREL